MSNNPVADLAAAQVASFTQPKLSLEQQRVALRSQLQLQRILIAQQLGKPVPVPGGSSSHFRSATFRFLNGRSPLVTHLLMKGASMILGKRFLASISAGMAVLKLVKAHRHK